MSDTSNVEAEAPEIEDVATEVDNDVELDGDREVDTEETDPETGEPIISEPDDSEEIEHDGVKHKIPKALLPLLLTRKDYTQKTMELSESRKALESERTAWVSQQAAQQAEAETTMAERVKVHNLREQVASKPPELWDAAFAEAQQSGDPSDLATVNRAWAQFQALERQLAVAESELSGKTKAQQEQAAKAQAEQLAEVGKVLHAEIEDFPNAAPKIIEIASSIGVTVEELHDNPDPRTWIGLNKLRLANERIAQLEAAATSNKTVTTIAKTQASTPAVSLKGGGTPTTGLNDRSSYDTWLKSRNADLAKKRA